MIDEPLDGEVDRRVLTTEPGDTNQRLDTFLRDRCPDLSRNRIQSELADGQVLVDGVARPKGYRLQPGMEIVFTPRPRQPLTAVAQDIPLHVLYEDDDMLIINKQAGLVVHPAPGHPDGTLVNGLLHHFGDLAAGDDPLRPGIVHRLDRDTTGLLVVARHDRALTALQQQIQARTMGRIYQALSWGRWAEEEGVLEGDIGRDPKRRQRMAVVQQGGRAATTRYRVQENFEFVQLCRVELETGRTHQIRVHFARSGHPVVGDPLYGDDARARGAHHLDRKRAMAMVRATGRQMLHAGELHLRHPADEREMVFSAPLPPDMATVLAGLAESA
ncbi:RluA family pseudouridine synthase [bacterium]|nr:MAG: RluA family pseudouridine synthase [bacterium]